MDSGVRLIVNPVRRRRILTVRWNIEYLIGRLVCLLNLSGESMPKEPIFDALMLFEEPRELVARLERSHVPYSPEVFPSYLMDSLSLPIPRVTPSCEDALGLGVSKGLIRAEKRSHRVVFEVTNTGRALARTLLTFYPEDATRATLALMMARTL